jgi:chemotaxis family two-component system sensor kinase Cph1
LRILSLYVQMLNKRCQLLPDAARFTVQIQESAERMRQLVADLLVHSRSIHESALSVPTEPNRALAKAITSLTDTISITGAVIRHEPLPSVFAAEPDLELVFRNLIANALKYRADKAPEVDITATVTNGQCTIAVRDNGIGISPEYHQQVFGLFKRLHGREVPGTGVGLAVTRNVIEKHGGRIWVESEAGSGATFKFQLQLTSAAAVA